MGIKREADDDWVKVVELAPEPVLQRYRITLALNLLKVNLQRGSERRQSSTSAMMSPPRAT
jgi:hypothetical protein